MEFVKTVDVGRYLKDPTTKEAKEDCKAIAESFHKTGILIIKDPRVTYEHNSKFLDMVEKYFEKPDEEKVKDSRPELAYQVGPTPEQTEKPRDRTELIKEMEDKNKPTVPTGKDAKWRYFWQMSNALESKYKELNAGNVIPKGMPDWEEKMNTWGKLLLGAVYTVSEMLAIGCGLEADAFTSRMKNAPHLLAPTATNLKKYNKVGDIMAGFHVDLSFITIHGKSRYPGLNAWLRNGEKFPVAVPNEHLILQTGMQAEHLTANYLPAGFHEVVVNERTLAKLEEAQKKGGSHWRVSSTLFSHIASDVELKPLGHFETKENLEKYKPIQCGQFVLNELKAINLSQ
mmetsp:Transcript_9968/g.14682  ORF Transcript_9968/g.14682 Transcript_9968/m.14682 type:complete len:343 (-) Transcript_9968:5538-6566(-)